jgi:hypothetical protein
MFVPAITMGAAGIYFNIAEIPLFLSTLAIKLHTGGTSPDVLSYTIFND